MLYILLCHTLKLSSKQARTGEEGVEFLIQGRMVSLDDHHVVPPFSRIMLAISFCVRSASMVTTRPSNISICSSCFVAGISLVLSSTAFCPSVNPRPWLTAESTWASLAPCFLLARRVFPSILMPCSVPGGEDF